MFCHNCGKQIPDGTKFCHYCGAAQDVEQNQEAVAPQPMPQAASQPTSQAVNQSAPQPIPQPVPSAQHAAPQNTAGSQNKILLLLLLPAFLFVILIGGVAIYLISNHAAGNRPKNISSVISEDMPDVPSGALYDYYVSILSADATVDTDGKPTLVVMFEFTNNSNAGTTFTDAVVAMAYQGYGYDDYLAPFAGVAVSDKYDKAHIQAIYGNSVSLEIPPGGTARIEKTFSLRDTVTDVEVVVMPITWPEGEKPPQLLKTFSFGAGSTLTSLSDGAYSSNGGTANAGGTGSNMNYGSGSTDGTAHVPDATDAADIPAYLPFSDCLGSYHVAILSGNVAVDSENNPLLIVSYEFTNNTGTEMWFNVAMQATASQDGEWLLVANDSVNPSYGIDMSKGAQAVQPGESLQIEKAFQLKNMESDVMAVVSPIYWEDPDIEKPVIMVYFHF